MENMKNENAMVATTEELERALRLLESQGFSVSKRDDTEDDSTLGVKDVVKMLNEQQLTKEIVTNEVEVFTDYKVKKLLEDGLLKGFKGNSNKQGYRLTKESVETFINDRKLTKTELQQQVKELQKEVCRLKKKYEPSKEIDEICEGQTNIEEFIDLDEQKEDPGNTDNEQELIDYLKELDKKRPHFKSVEAMLSNIFDVKKEEIKGKKSNEKWEMFKELCLDEKTDKKEVLKQIKQQQEKGEK